MKATLELILSVTFMILEDKLEFEASLPKVNVIFKTKSSCWKSVNPAAPLSTGVFPCFLTEREPSFSVES